MTENMSVNDSVAWKKFLKRRWGAAALAGVGAAVAIIGAVLVFLWYAGEAQASGLVPSSLAAWSIGSLVDFLLHLAVWEIFLIAIPAAVAAIVAWAWWKRLPFEERMEYERGGNKRKNRRSDAGNGFSFLFFLVFLLKVYLDGNWNLPFSSWTFDYLVDSMVWVFVSVLIVFGIPALIAGLWWLRRQVNRVP
jgi:hypothetical protein